jgi:alkaline phosphatase
MTFEAENSVAKNVIFMVGDGMGLSQITAGMYANGNSIAFEKFRKIGFHKCYAYNDLVTDSAAGATAFSTGHKTYNGAIGVGPDTLALETIIEEAEERGYHTGMVTSSTIVHATPASFIAHNRLRRNYEEIAADFLETDIDLFIGGGLKYFNRRQDGRDLTAELEQKGYFMSDYFKEDLDQIDFSEHSKVGYLTSDADPLPVAQGRDYLPSATSKALDFLHAKSKGEKGFFLMIEGAQIDWGGHANNGEYIVSEMIDFSKTIDVVWEFIQYHPETIVIITADHETGGLAINKGSRLDSLDMRFTSDYHTADMIPVFAEGPRDEEFMGIYENTAIYNKMRRAFGWEEISN